VSTTPARSRAAARRRPVRRGKAAVVLAQSIAREIDRRGLKVGDKLLSEQKMVERYGVARGSLREALRYLELQGVLRIKSGPGGGPLIQIPDGRHFASTLALMLQFVGARFRTPVPALTAGKFPLRITRFSENGKVRDVVELKSIANAGVNAADFAIPAGYTDALQHSAATAH